MFTKIDTQALEQINGGVRQGPNGEGCVQLPPNPLDPQPPIKGPTLPGPTFPGPTFPGPTFPRPFGGDKSIL